MLIGVEFRGNLAGSDGDGRMLAVGRSQEVLRAVMLWVVQGRARQTSKSRTKAFILVLLLRDGRAASEVMSQHGLSVVKSKANHHPQQRSKGNMDEDHPATLCQADVDHPGLRAGKAAT